MAEIRIEEKMALARLPRRRGAPLDAAAALTASLVATALLVATLITFSVLAYDESQWHLPALVAQAVQARDASTGLALAFSLLLLAALAFLGIAAETPRSDLPLFGLGFGVALYFAVFHGLAGEAGGLRELRTADTLVAFGFFGLLLAQLYQAFSRR